MRCRLRITTSDAAFWLFVLFLSLEEILGRDSLSLLKRYNEDVPQSRRTWCEKTNPCGKCEERKRSRCLGQEEPLLGADLCECCFSCVAVRDLGESCGSQLSTWPEVLGYDVVSSPVTILATTWCREGLVCVNFLCHKLSDNVRPEISPRIASEFKEESTKSVNRDDPNLPKIVSSTLTAWTQSPSFPSLTELRKKPEPCYAKSEETMTISSYPSDDLLGEVATTTLNDGRNFQLVYTGDLLSELEVLFNVIDTFHGDSFLDEKTADSLVERFLNSSKSHPDDDELFLPDVLTPSEKTSTPLNPHNFLFPEPREKRELDKTEDDVVGLDAPKNIQEILIRGASAHREYVDGFRGNDQSTKTPNKSVSALPVEESSQEDESTVRVHITNHPRKVHTLIELEEDEEEEEIDDEDRRSLQLANRGHAKNAGKLSPLAEEQYEVSPGVQEPLGRTLTTEQNPVIKKTAESRPTDVPQVHNSPWNETLMTLNDRMTLVEVKTTVFEKVLEEMAKWCNLGVLSMTRDCLMPLDSDIRYGSWDRDPEEHLAVASRIDAVRIRENERKLNAPKRDGFHDTRIPDVAELDEIPAARRMAYGGRNKPINRNFFRTITGNGAPRRFKTSGYHGERRPAKSPCRKSANRGSSSWRKTIAENIGDLPAHRTVQRSVSGLGTRSNVDKIAPRDHSDTLPISTLREIQIPVPVALAKKVTTLQDVEKRELSPHEDVFRNLSASTAEITSPSDIPSSKMFIWTEKKEENEEPVSFPRIKSELGKLGLQRSTGRTKRSMKLIDGISPPHNNLRKIREGLSVSARRSPKLFERETAARKRLEPDINRSAIWGVATIAENDELKGVSGPLIVNGSTEFRNSPEPIANRLLFRNSIRSQTTESTGQSIPMILQNDRKLPDPRSATYSITNHGNSTIRIKEISENEYDDSLSQFRNSANAEDDFDHIYESVEAEDEGGDFEYDVAYDEVEYVDGSKVEMVTELPPGAGLREPEMKIKPVLDSSRNRRAPKNEDDDQCESGRPRKREMPLILFGSTGKHEPKTIVWPSKWIGYRRDSLRGTGGPGNQQTTLNSRSSATGSFVDTTTQSLSPRKTTESSSKILSLDRRARKNRRKIVWR